MTDPQRPVTWRDTYALVMEMESRVLTAIGELKADVRRVTDDHEARLRGLEQTLSANDGRASGAAVVISAGRAAALVIVAVAGFVLNIYVATR